MLVIEDDERTASALRRGLEAEHYTVEVANDGIDGLWLATETGADVIVLDIMLPGLNGYVVCRELRERGAGTPILMLTAKGGEWDEAEGLDTGADDYLVKPFSFTVLLARVRALLRRAGDVPSPLAVGDLRIDPACSPHLARGRRDRADEPSVRGARVPRSASRASAVEAGDPRRRVAP